MIRFLLACVLLATMLYVGFNGCEKSAKDFGHIIKVARESSK